MLGITVPRSEHDWEFLPLGLVKVLFFFVDGVLNVSMALLLWQVTHCQNVFNLGIFPTSKHKMEFGAFALSRWCLTIWKRKTKAIHIYLTPKASKRVLVALIIVGGNILRLVKKSRVSNVGWLTLQQHHAFVIKIQILVILHSRVLVLCKN